MVTGNYPFMRSFLDTKHDIENRIKQLDALIDPTLSPDARDLIRKILVSPTDRLTLEDILSHEWCTPHGSSAIF
jgi:serine/threonine protein kinase